MGFERPPEGLPVRATAGSVTVSIHPFLPESGRNDLRLLRLARYVLVALSLFGFFLGSVIRDLAWVALISGVTWMVVAAIRSARRQRSELTAEITRDEVRVVVSTDGKVDRDQRVFLRDVGRVDVIEAGYQRWHVVANVVGRDPLVIEMERHTAEAAQWLARELAAAGRGARERDGSGTREVPEPLRRMTERTGA